MKNILVSLAASVIILLFSASAIAGKIIKFDQPCALPISMEIDAGKRYEFDLMSCLQRPEGYSWNFYENQNVPKWMQLAPNGTLILEPTNEDRGTASIVAISTHGGSDFYFFPLEIEVNLVGDLALTCE